MEEDLYKLQKVFIILNNIYQCQVQLENSGSVEAYVSTVGGL